MSSTVQPPLRRTSPESRAATNALIENLVDEFSIGWLATYNMGEKFLALANLRGYVSVQDIDLIDPNVLAALKELEEESGVEVRSLLMERCQPRDEKREKSARKMGVYFICFLLFIMLLVAPLFEADSAEPRWTPYFTAIPGVFW